VGDRLRAVWDFDDLDASQRRFEELLQLEASDSARGDILTQLARVEGLRERFEAGEALVAEAEALGGASARVLLERGRLRRSSGDREEALPLFESAFALALEAGDEFIAVDAAHMAAMAAADREGMVTWAERGIEIAERSDEPDVRYWLGPLLNNLGWEYYGASEHEAALDAFYRALAARESDPRNAEATEIARYAVAKTLNAIGRPGEAASLLEQAIAWTSTLGNPDGWFHEELAAAYAALGRKSEAREQAELALPLLLAQDESFAVEGERAERLRALAA